MSKFFKISLYMILSFLLSNSACFTTSNDGTDETPVFKVEYDMNGATGGSVPVDSHQYQNGQTIIILGNPGNLVKRGFNFSGWNTHTDGNGITYTGGENLVISGSDIILYAHWTVAQSYNVVYDGNGNTGGVVPVDGNSYFPGDPVSVASNTGSLVKTGYTFYGWNTMPDGTGSTYSDTDQFAMESSDITLYAIWGGDIDDTFLSGSGFSANTNCYVKSMAIQDDGKIIIGGIFSSYNGTTRNNIVRLNADGSIDTSFNPGTGTDSVIHKVVVQSDGKILIGGAFSTYNGTSRKCVARLNTNGTLDTSFAPGNGASGSLYGVYDIAIQDDGKIYIGGAFTFYNVDVRNRLARLNSDGSLDTSYNPGTGTNDIINDIAIQSDGKILIAGFFTSYRGSAVNRIARLNTDATIDSTFNIGTGTDNIIDTLLLLDNGKILIGGVFISYNLISRKGIARLNSDGSLDTSFDPGSGAENNYFSDSRISALAVQSDGKIIIGGRFETYDGIARKNLAIINSDGSLNSSFQPGTGTNYSVYSILIQNTEKFIMGGDFTQYSGTTQNKIVRIFK